MKPKSTGRVRTRVGWLPAACFAWAWLFVAGQAFEIANVTRSLVLFSDDFERGSAGFAPSPADPEPGTWLFNADPILLVASRQTDGVQASQGTNSLKIARGQRPRLTANGEPDAVRESQPGDLMRLEFAIRVQSGVASVYPRAVDHDIAQISFFADGRVSVVNAAGQAHQFLQQTLQPQAWNRVRLDFTNGGAAWSVSLNESAPEIRTGGSSDDYHSGGLLAGARWQTDEAGTVAFIDHTSAPSLPPPALRFELSGGSVVFRWDGASFRLETSFVLGEPEAWFPVPDGTNSPTRVAFEEAAQYFRLSSDTSPLIPPRDIGSQIQLLVDESLIASREHVQWRVMPVEKAGAPLISPDEPWEGTAIQLSGVVRDPRDSRFKMWYTTHADADSGKLPGARTCYAESADGIHWVKPRLNLADFQGSRENSLVLDIQSGAAAPALDYVVLDPRPGEDARRFKAMVVSTGGYHLWFSADGLRWEAYDQNPVCDTTGDVCPTIFDERVGEFVAFMKTTATVAGRARRVVGRRSSPDMVHWTPNEAVLVPDSWEDERARVMMATRRGWMEYYGMVGFPYAGVYLGLLWPFFCNPEPAGTTEGVLHVELAWSQDGRQWRHAADRSPFIPRGTPGSFDGGMTFTAVRPLVLGEEIWVYYNGWEATHASHWYGEPSTDEPLKRGFISLGKLPRDRWVAAEAAQEDGRLTTVPLLFQGQSLFVNADTAQGRLVVEIIDEHYRPIPGFRAEECRPLAGVGAGTQRVSWPGQAGVGPWAGHPVRLRFLLDNARLFSFGFGG